MKEKAVIGWTEYVDLTEWGIPSIKAKIDTGARTSALHVEDLEILESGEVGFHVVHGSRKRPKTTYVVTRPQKWARVRSSNGHFQRRCFVVTEIRIGSLKKKIEISLVSRDKMLFRMLLGRKALQGDFLVNVGKRAALTKKREDREWNQ